jgi:ribulose-phosphate 3-epimerase
MKQHSIISPSILSADFARLGEDTQAVLDAGADWVHFDVMDNHFVPNMTIGPMVCKALRNHGITAPIDVHLMVQPVDDLIVEFAKAGASMILDWSLEQLDMVLLMSVNPGFGGQSFIPYVMEKISRVRSLIDATGQDIRLEIDGGVTVDNIGSLAKAGVDTFVSGSAIFGTDDYAETIAKMRKNIDA